MNTAEDFWVLTVARRHFSMVDSVGIVDMKDMVDKMDMVDSMNVVDSIEMVNMQKSFG